MGRYFDELTPREMEVFRYLSEGKRDKDVAQIMGVGNHQVRALVCQGCLRLGAETRAQAVAMLIRKGKLK